MGGNHLLRKFKVPYRYFKIFNGINNKKKVSEIRKNFKTKLITVYNYIKLKPKIKYYKFITYLNTYVVTFCQKIYIKKQNIKKFNLIKLIKKKLPFKKKKISKKTDLINENILDSLELMNLIIFLEKNSKFKVKNYLKKKKKFIVQDIEKFLN